MKNKSLEKKLISNIQYNNMNNNISPLDAGVQQVQKAKRTRRTKHTFKLGDIKKDDVKATGFTTKQQALKFLNALDKKYTDFKTKDELVDYVKSKKDKLDLDFSKWGKNRKIKKTKNFMKLVQQFEGKLAKYDERKPKKFHITAEIKRGITFTSKKGKVTKYGSNTMETKDILLDSRVIEAKSEQEAREIMVAEIEEAFSMDDYSGAAKYNVDAINFIDTVNESSLTQQHPSQMKMKLAEPVEYSFTHEEKKFLNKDGLTGSCVIDNFIGVYGEELKITRNDFIKLHHEFYNKPFCTLGTSYLDDGIVSESKSMKSDLIDGTFTDSMQMIYGNYYNFNFTPPVFDDDESSEEEPVVEVEEDDISDMWKEGITPLFLEHVCKRYDISMYAYDINNACFLKNVSKNKNHTPLVYYAINNHMYLVNDKHKQSLRVRATAMEHSIKTSLLESVEKENPFDGLGIIENIDFNDIEKYDNISCVLMFSRNIHNINDIFYLFLDKYNTIPKVDKSHKTNIMQFTHNNNGIIHIYAADPNEVHTITYKQVKYLCDKNEIEFKNQTFMQLIKQMKNKFFNEKNGRIQFTKEQRAAVLNRFNCKCNICKCTITDDTFEIDHKRSLANGGTNKASNLQALCKSCHKDKCTNEHENGEYIKIIDSESTFNKHVQSIIDSPLAQTNAFIECLVKDVDVKRKIFTIDKNKCRKNILYYGIEHYCVFTVFDKVNPYEKREYIQPGLYYIESKNYMPLRGNGFYYHNMIKYCLENNIISHDDIKYEIISSLTIPANYYNEFIEYCYKNIDNYDVICEKLNISDYDMKDYKKLAINVTVGEFKPNVTKRANWKSLCITNNSSEAFTNYINNDGAFMHSFKIKDKKYYHTYKQGYKTNLENEIPIYNHYNKNRLSYIN